MSSLILGGFLILLGIVIGLNTFGITDINIFFSGWWTLFIIIPALNGLFKEKKLDNIIWLIIGILLLLSCQNIIDFDLVWKLIVPIILIMIGLSFIFKNTFNNKIIKELNKKSKNNEICATFSEQNIKYDEKFEGNDLNAIFGSIKCDLEEAKIEEDIVINIVAIFGGIDIIMPDNINVKIKSTAIFGGVEDKRKIKKIENKPTIYINATCIFGGVDVK